MQDLEQAIRERAYHLWVADGCNDGNANSHWLLAQREVLASSLDGIAQASPPSEAKPAKKTKAKAVTTKTSPTKRKSKAA